MQHKNLPRQQDKQQEQSMYQIVLFNDDYNTFDHVIDVLMAYCEHTEEQAEQCAWVTHLYGKCSVKEGTYEQLEPVAMALLEEGLSVEIH
ncbi:MAG: ATP-dependent Clp protease adaptor ClpS [Chlorobi bacterium]|nr:ATP-dependent Clp protease adaptor ClpS [Chlorobiota bacterium]